MADSTEKLRAQLAASIAADAAAQAPTKGGKPTGKVLLSFEDEVLFEMPYWENTTSKNEMKLEIAALIAESPAKAIELIASMVPSMTVSLTGTSKAATSSFTKLLAKAKK